MMKGFSFELQHCDGTARAGVLNTPRSRIETPVFMPVGTQATVKTQSPAEVSATGARMILANTYHLWLRPGDESLARFGGLHRFMNWPHSILTDSGGFQIFSLSKLRTLDDDGVVFRSHINGDLKRMSPEDSLRIQGNLGSDIAMVLDECPSAEAERAIIETALRRTTAWARRSAAVPPTEGQARFGIVQGAGHLDLRLRHLEEIAALPFDGFALGGFSVGEPPEVMHELLPAIAPAMPAELPRYLMGVGTPKDILIGVAAGMDMFDCVLPTRNARNGQALTWGGRVNLKQARHIDDKAPLDSRCRCEACTSYSRAYLRHLFTAHEMLGPRLLTTHNLHFYADLMRQSRSAIQQGHFATFVKRTLRTMEEEDEVGA